MCKLNIVEINLLKGCLLGTSADPVQVAERLGILYSADLTELESQLANVHISRCTSCDDWCETGYLYEDIDGRDVCVGCIDDMENIDEDDE
jgi:hypothetical protein